MACILGIQNDIQAAWCTFIGESTQVCLGRSLKAQKYSRLRCMLRVKGTCPSEFVVFCMTFEKRAMYVHENKIIYYFIICSTYKESFLTFNLVEFGLTYLLTLCKDCLFHGSISNMQRTAI